MVHSRLAWLLILSSDIKIMQIPPRPRYASILLPQAHKALWQVGIQYTRTSPASELAGHT